MDQVDANRRLAERLKLNFPLLSDPDRRVVQLYGVEERKTGEGYPPGIANPAVFVVDSTGKIRFKYVSRDYADRPPNSTLLAALRGL